MPDLAESESHVAQVGFAYVGSRLRDHLGSHVDANHTAHIAHLTRREKRIESRAAPRSSTRSPDFSSAIA